MLGLRHRALVRNQCSMVTQDTVASQLYARKLFEASKVLDIELAERLFSLMKEEGVPRTREHYASLFTMFLHLEKPDRLEFYIELMKVDGLRVQSCDAFSPSSHLSWHTIVFCKYTAEGRRRKKLKRYSGG